MAKKQKKATPERVPTKRQLSKWQREEKIRRIAIIASAVFLAGILSWVGYKSYEDYRARTAAWREVVIEVNDVSFTMEYFVDMLDVYTKGIDSETLNLWGDYIAGMVANMLIQSELTRQGAENLGIHVTSAEIDRGLQERGWPNDRVYRDIVAANLSQEKLQNYFGLNLTDTMEQARVQVMLVESEEVAAKLIAQIEPCSNITVFAAEYSCNSSVEGDLGWLPRELMPNTLIADAAFNLTLCDISSPIYDKDAIKDVGYWLIEVTDKQGEKIKARAMLLGSEEEAERVKSELASGNFSSLAQKYSQHKSKTEGGELGLLGRGDMGSDTFDAVAFNITANEVSEPVKDVSVQTTGGYWLVMVVDRGVQDLDEETREKLIDKRLNDWFEEWRKNSTIENMLTTEKKSWAVNKVLQGR
ncbi:MAG: peptidylprolyl isomerase [Chloroflexi bacterium]|nr:peptidylprolyl isomerase [Chloroflexota bacterium]